MERQFELESEAVMPGGKVTEGGRTSKPWKKRSVEANHIASGTLATHSHFGELEDRLEGSFKELPRLFNSWGVKLVLDDSEYPRNDPWPHGSYRHRVHGESKAVEYLVPGMVVSETKNRKGKGTPTITFRSRLLRRLVEAGWRTVTVDNRLDLLQFQPKGKNFAEINYRIWEKLWSNWTHPLSSHVVQREGVTVERHEISIHTRSYFNWQIIVDREVLPDEIGLTTTFVSALCHACSSNFLGYGYRSHKDSSEKSFLERPQWDRVFSKDSEISSWEQRQQESIEAIRQRNEEKEEQKRQRRKEEKNRTKSRQKDRRE